MKAIVSILLVIATLLTSAGIMVGSGKEEIKTARIVETQRTDVYQTIGLQGQIVYADDRYILASESGRIACVFVEEDQRLYNHEMVVQYHAMDSERLAEAYVSAMSDYRAANNTEELLESYIRRSVQRIDADCTVRQVMVAEGDLVTQGMPLLRVSASEQEVRCIAAQADAERIQPGMWGWINCNGERCSAQVKRIEKVKDDDGMICYMITLMPEQKQDKDEGSVVDVDIYIAGSVDVVALPLEAITESDTVWWVNDEGRCTEISAEIVMCDEMNAWVNLPEGIRVAVGEFEEGQRIQEAAE